MTRNPVPCRYVVYGLFQRVEGATTAIIFVQHYSHLNSHYSMVCGKELKAVGPAPPLTLASADGQWHACYCASQYHPMWRESEARPKSQEHNILGILQQILCVLILLWSIGADHDVIKPVINRVNEAAARMTISPRQTKNASLIALSHWDVIFFALDSFTSMQARDCHVCRRNDAVIVPHSKWTSEKLHHLLLEHWWVS